MDSWIAELKTALEIIHGDDPVRVFLILALIGVVATSYFLLRLTWRQWQKAQDEIDRLHTETADKLRTLEALLIEVRTRRESHDRE